MSIIKEEIKFYGADMNFKFNLDSVDNFLGYQQEIDNLTQNTSVDLINPAVDVEQRRYKYASSVNTTTIQFKFTQNGTAYTYKFTSAGFTQNEITTSSSNVLNSFFIFDTYDTYNINTQTKILTTYLTKIGSEPKYQIKSSNQIYCLYVPIDYINTQLDLGFSATTAYTKISFYNAKSGGVTVFFNEDFDDSTTPQYLFFPIKLDFLNRTWKFISIASSNVYAKQIWISQEYINKVNDTFTNFNNESQNYPKGSAFDYNNGKYI